MQALSIALGSVAAALLLGAIWLLIERTRLRQRLADISAQRLSQDSYEIGVEHLLLALLEFDFAIEDDLVVELVMPYREFVTFCEEHEVRVLPAEGEAALVYMQLAETYTTSGQEEHE